MNPTVTARSFSPLVGFVAALALVAAAVLAGFLTTAGHNQAGAAWNIPPKQAGAAWNVTSHQAGAAWNVKVGGSSTDGAAWN